MTFSLTRLTLLLAAALLVPVRAAQAQGPADPTAEVEAVYAQADALYRDLHQRPELSGHEQKTAETLAAGLKARVKNVTPELGSEDFSRVHTAGIATLMLRVGASDPTGVEASEQGGAPLPSLHSPLFAPQHERTLKTAIAAEIIALRELMPVRAGPSSR